MSPTEALLRMEAAEQARNDWDHYANLLAETLDFIPDGAPEIDNTQIAARLEYARLMAAHFNKQMIGN